MDGRLNHGRHHCCIRTDTLAAYCISLQDAGMLIIKWLLIVVALIVIAGVLAGQLGLLKGKAPTDLGVHDGRLKPPSKTPNSVSSQACSTPTTPSLLMPASRRCS